MPHPKLLTEIKNNITNHTKLLEPDSVKTPQAQLRPNYFRSWTRGSLAKQTANMRPQNKDTPQREHIHHLRTQPEDLTHTSNTMPPQTQKIAPRNRVHAGRSEVSCFAFGPLHARGQNTRVVKHAKGEAVDRLVRDDTV